MRRPPSLSRRNTTEVVDVPPAEVVRPPGPARPPRAARQDQALQAAAAATATAAGLSSASRDVSSSFSTVASAMTELRASIGEIAGNASRASSTASTAVTHAATVTRRVTALEEAAEAIGGIVGVIASITAQSRMLALNATIEAARAGEAGRGFAVVAQEVKALADKTAQAADHVRRQIASVQHETHAAVTEIGQITDTIDEIFEAQGAIAAAVEQQTAVADSIVEHVDRAAAGSERITTSVAELARAQQLAFVRTAITTARTLLEDSGGMQLGDTRARWTARHQSTEQTVQVQLPQVLVGGQWLGQNDDPNRRTPFVDDVTALVGGATTVFQRLNAAGDMLRVATDVRTAHGRRNISTYIPAREPDGRPNPVLAQVLAGQTYLGDAVVAGRPYFTAYDPVRSSSGEIIGMLYVGMPQ